MAHRASRVQRLHRVAVLALVLIFSACAEDDEPTAESTSTSTTAEVATTQATTTSTPTTTTSSTTTTEAPTTSSTVELGGGVGPDTPSVATATVQVLQLVADDDGLLPGCFAGSGSIIDADGLILTNAHVLENDSRCPFDTIGIAILDEQDRPPVLSYVADLLVLDQALDLAVVRIANDLDGDDVDAEFPFLALGDSEDVELGDPVRVLGYPAIGGDTITLTRGAVSGFTEQRDIDGRAWIKTDATISGGNSGGVAVDEFGRLVGVPTIAGSGADVDPTDCRAIQDTNGDGFLDERDSCVPIGGFINGLRPINLALPLIETAESATPIPIEPVTIDEPPLVIDAEFGPISFSTGVTELDEPVDVVTTVPTGATDRVCGFWDYTGMVDGATYDALWYLDGELIEEASILATEWFGGASGDWWVCFIGSDGALFDGSYELVLNVEGELASSDAIVVGGDGSLVTFELVNETAVPICFVLLSLSDAQNWGPDDLGPTETIPPSSTRAFELSRAFYDLRALDCGGEVVVEDFVIDVSGPQRYVVTG